MPIVEVKSYEQGELKSSLTLPEAEKKVTVYAKAQSKRKKARKQVTEEPTGTPEAPQAES